MDEWGESENILREEVRRWLHADVVSTTVNHTELIANFEQILQIVTRLQTVRFLETAYMTCDEITVQILLCEYLISSIKYLFFNKIFLVLL